jgi:hypothetical protein
MATDEQLPPLPLEVRGHSAKAIAAGETGSIRGHSAKAIAAAETGPTDTSEQPDIPHGLNGGTGPSVTNASTFVPSQMWEPPPRRPNASIAGAFASGAFDPGAFQMAEELQARADRTIAGGAAVAASTGIAVGAGIAVGMSTVVTRAPFSPGGIAERIANDPDYYRRLSEFASAELTQEIAKFHGQGNADLVIKGELVKLQQGFAEIAKHISAKAYDAAAAVVVSLKDGLVAFHDSHPELVDIFGKLAAVSLSTYTLGAIGVPVALGVLVTASVVNSEKLADILKAWMGK